MKLIIEENEQKMSESAMHILLGAMMQDKPRLWRLAPCFFCNLF